MRQPDRIAHLSDISHMTFARLHRRAVLLQYFTRLATLKPNLLVCGRNPATVDVVQFLVALKAEGIITGRDLGAILKAFNSP